ncbi:MAG: hypothetical protein PHU51_00785 [Candidatus Nanoarchaeia archaeon]|nr:hypothetical protein [Candidatus Nanoarchaeia archaeon]
MNKKYLLGTLLFLALFLTGCGIDKISDIKSAEYVDQTVTVKGTVENTIKLGELSGFSLSDGEDMIFISSTNLPSEGSTQKVKGILRKNLLGYYVETN